ncbi:MAG: SDR family NAD(P)-dependent oxidoreductase [Pseudomonadota bacterium]|nr:SDR family NAD(P)-dependent oxidoreductase [Pseudomonadota bacterium]
MTTGSALSLSESCAVVVGVGASQGIGAAVCRRAAREGYRVYVVGRTQAKLDQVVAEITQQGGQAVACCVDATNAAKIAGLFAAIAAEQPTIDLVVNNVGSNMPSRFLSTSPRFFDQMWRTTFLSGYLVSQQALALMLPQQHGTLIFTGASASLRGKPFFAAFTNGKAGLRAYIQAIAPVYRLHGIHIAHVIVDGMVDGDRINQFGFGVGRVIKWLLKGRQGGLSIEAIAESYWQIHQQSSALWTQEIDLRPFKERF